MNAIQLRMRWLMAMAYSHYPKDWKTISHRIRFVRAGYTVAYLGTPHADGVPGDKRDTMDVREENLAALCLGCHPNYDRASHVAHARETRRRKREALTRQQCMFDGEVTS